MSLNSLSVGKEAIAYCTSCKMDLNHTIVAMHGDRIIKVQCRTCRKDHAYKAPKGIKDPTVAPEVRVAKEKEKAAKKSAAEPVAVEYE